MSDMSYGEMESAGLGWLSAPITEPSRCDVCGWEIPAGNRTWHDNASDRFVCGYTCAFSLLAYLRVDE